MRPDLDPVEAWFDFEPETGRLVPAPDLEPTTRSRVRLTIRIFGLNTKERCTSRQQFFRVLDRALRTRDVEYLTEALQQAPYRYIVRKFLAANRSRIGWLV